MPTGPDKQAMDDHVSCDAFHGLSGRFPHETRDLEVDAYSRGAGLHSGSSPLERQTDAEIVHQRAANER